jgi:alkyldihydroxyacetonephosphate synthase
MTVGLGDGPLAPLVRGWLRVRGVSGGCLLLLGAAGDALDVDVALEQARLVVGDLGGAWLGRRPGRHWLRDRFRHPYLRDGLFDLGLGTDTLETAAPWSRLGAVYDAVRQALRAGVRERDGEREIPVLCHLSHPYADGASLYFTYFFRCPDDGDGDRAVARWADLKRRAASAIAAVGGATSHHHGVGTWHAPWAGAEWGASGRGMLDAVARHLDPAGVMHPHVLLDATDRLEE